MDKMRKTLLILFLVLIASGCTTTLNVGNGQQQENSTVTDVVDGDTVKINLDGTEETIRLLGVDTPEVHIETQPREYEDIPDNERGRNCLRKWGEKASTYAEKNLGNKEIVFETDSLSDTRGSYGRLLGYINVNGTNFNYRLVEKGLAKVYNSEFSQKQRFLEAEREAKNSKKGLWQCQEYELSNLTVK